MNRRTFPKTLLLSGLAVALALVMLALPTETSSAKDRKAFDYGPVEGIDTTGCYMVGYAIQKNLFSFFREELRSYDSPLKRKVFKKTDEAKRMLGELREFKREALSKSYEVKVGSGSKYDLKKKAFRVTLDDFPGIQSEKTAKSRGQSLKASGDTGVVGKLWLPDSLRVRLNYVGSAAFRYFRVGVPEEKALEIENSKCDVFLRFRLTGKLKKWTFHGRSGIPTNAESLRMKDMTVIFRSRAGDTLFEKALR